MLSLKSLDALVDAVSPGGTLRVNKELKTGFARALEMLEIVPSRKNTEKRAAA